MKTLTVFRERQGAYNQLTTLKDAEGKVKATFSSMLSQPRKNQGTIEINSNLFKLDWQNVK
jgi:hypothetical protein